MSSTIEAAERLEKEIARVESALENHQKTIANIKEEGIESVDGMEEHTNLLKAIIETNKKTAKQLRDSAIDG